MKKAHHPLLLSTPRREYDGTTAEIGVNNGAGAISLSITQTHIELGERLIATAILTPELARQLAVDLIERADELEDRRSITIDPSTGDWLSHAPLESGDGPRIAASVLPGVPVEIIEQAYAQWITADPAANGPHNLTASVTVEVKPTEVLHLIYGTGAIGYFWWNTVVQKRDGKVVEFNPDLESAEAHDTFVFLHEDAEAAEMREKRTEVTMQQIVDAAALAAREGLLDDENTSAVAAGEIGLLDAPGADVVLQLAVFGGKSPIFG